MRRLRTLVTVAAFAALGGSIAWGLLGDAAMLRDRALLEEIQRAEETLSFVGVRTITINHPGGAVTTRLRVLGRAGQRKVEFEKSALPRRELKGRRPAPGPFSWLGLVRGAVRGFGHLGHVARFRDPALVVENYRLVRLGPEAVANRPADRCELVPRHAGRPSYRLWVDAANRFLLRLQVISPGAAVVFESSHAEIDFRPTFGPDDFAAPRRWHDRGERRSTNVENLRGLNFVAWLPGRPPEGFRLRSCGIFRVKGLEAMYTLYSDGLAWLTVVEFPASNPLWRQLRETLPGFSVIEERVARRIECPGGTLMHIRLEGTEVFAAGQLGAEELERTLRTLKKAN